MPEINIKAIQLADTSLPERLSGLWNAALGPQWVITPPAVAYDLRPSAGHTRALALAEIDGLPVGFVLAETPDGGAEGSLNALVVDARFQRRGAGSALLAWALDWFAARGVREIWLGGGARPWIPGLPDVDARARDFFARRGFTLAETVWDMARSLKDYGWPRLSQRPLAEIRPAQAEDLPALFDLLARDFPYWLGDVRQFFGDGGRPADILLLHASGGLRAFCWTTFSNSARPIQRFFPNALGQPWGQLGSIGTAEDSRGRGYAGVMIDFALRRLQALGIDGCVIDWTVYLDFYARFGFAPYHAYWMMMKKL